MRARWRLPGVAWASVVMALAGVALPTRVEAFGPAAHYVVMEKVAQGLPQASRIRQALAQHPDIAGAAASGPDVPYCQPRGALGYAPWADRYHYDWVGTFARTQLQRALAARDAAQLAWAAGWVTHVAADMAAHGRYVNPEAGVYLEDPNGRGLHKRLESAAEVAVWVDIGGHSQDSYSKRAFPAKFCGASALPLSLLDGTSSQVFGRSPGRSYREWYQVFKTGLSTGVGYTYAKYPEAQRFLDDSDRRSRLTHSVAEAVNLAIALLQSAERGDYTGFSDAWNLDAGDDGSPFGTLTVSLRTGDDRGAGTDADIYFGLTFSDGATKEWRLGKEGYNDCERGDDDDYYLFLSDRRHRPSEVTQVQLRMGPEHGLGVAWQVASVRVRVNGKLVFAQSPSVWLRHEGEVWQSGGWRAKE